LPARYKDMAGMKHNQEYKSLETMNEEQVKGHE
jgi:hypothetical protein